MSKVRFLQQKLVKALFMKRVLLINDDADFQFLMKNLLEKKGFNAQTIDATDDVISLVERFAPEVIIIDMKAETDKRICTEVRKKIKTQAKLILLTDKSIKPTDMHECKPDVVISKPFQPDDLIRKIVM